MAVAVREYGEEILIANRADAMNVHGDGADPVPPSDLSTDTIPQRNSESSEQVVSSSSYVLASDVSDLSGDVDRWLNGSNSSPPGPGVQGSRTPAAQRSTAISPCTANSLWYLAAMILPLFSIHNCVMTLRCTPSTVANAAEVIVQHLYRLCSRAKAHIQRMVRDRFASEVFAATMDVVLVVYALGFLFLSMYQATLIG